jgi:hypothetical protein
MAVYLITWDLNKEKPNYADARRKFLGRLDQYENIKDSGLDSVRFVSTTWTANQVSDDLRKYMDNDDRIIVTQLISGRHNGWLNKAVWAWINARF